MHPYYLSGIVLLGAVFVLVIFWKIIPHESADMADDAAFRHILNLDYQLECRVHEKFSSIVTEELNRRNALNITRQIDEGVVTICCDVRLADMFDFVKRLRRYGVSNISVSIQPKFGKPDHWSEKEEAQLLKYHEKVLSLK